MSKCPDQERRDNLSMLRKEWGELTSRTIGSYRLTDREARILWDEIERLTRRVAELQQFHDWAEPQIHDHGRDVITIAKLRAALEEAIEGAEEIAPGIVKVSPWSTWWLNRTKALISGELSSPETTARRCDYVGMFGIQCALNTGHAGQHRIMPAEKASPELAPVYQRKCARCGKVTASATPEGVGVYYCSIECAD